VPRFQQGNAGRAGIDEARTVRCRTSASPITIRQETPVHFPARLYRCHGSKEHPEEHSRKHNNELNDHY
jgi:hypothetical protein